MRADSRAGIVARVYAETLLRVAEREGALDEVSVGLGRLARAIEESDPFRRFLAGPQIAGNDKRALVQGVFEDRVHPVVMRFLELLIERRRESLVGEVDQAWRALLDARANRRSATVTTAILADPGTLDAIRLALERATGQDVTLEERVDASLLGGLVVRTGDLVMDASLRSRLDVLRHRLRAAVAAGATGAR